MARIRTIKPEICTSEQIVECSTNARLLFVLMWCFCDDAGRHPASIRRLKMEVFPGDDFDLGAMQSMIDELLNQRLLLEYEYDGKRFWQVTGWKHQKIDRPNYKYGPLTPDGKPAKFDECSTNARRVDSEQSPPEGKGMEGSLNNAANESPREKPKPPNEYSEAFEEWWKAYPANSKGRKRGKKKCYGLWRRVPVDDRHDCLTAAKNYAKEENEFVKDPERFLASDFWRDYIEAAEAVAKGPKVATAEDLEAWNG